VDSRVFYRRRGRESTRKAELPRLAQAWSGAPLVAVNARRLRTVRACDMRGLG